MNTQDKDIVTNAAATEHFSTFSNALKAAGLEAAYKGPGPFTVFAPTDEAFEKLPAGELHALLKDKAKLASILNYHATKGSLLAADIKQHFLPSIQGQSLQMAPSDTGFMVNDAKGRCARSRPATACSTPSTRCSCPRPELPGNPDGGLDPTVRSGMIRLHISRDEVSVFPPSRLKRLRSGSQFPPDHRDRRRARLARINVMKEMTMATGTVKWFNDAKGFGFITPRVAVRTSSRTIARSRARASSP
jgi:hypothetical protein